MKFISETGRCWVASMVMHGSALLVLLRLATNPALPRAPIVMDFIARPSSGPRAAVGPGSPGQTAPQAAPRRVAPRPPVRREALPHPRSVAVERAGLLPLPTAAPASAPAPAAALAAGAAAGATGPSGAVGAQAPHPGGGGAGDADLGGYLGAVNQRVNARKRYPALALQAELEGEILILLRLARDGHLATAPVVVRSSGHPILDGEALAMVGRAAPFPPLPPAYPHATAEVRVPVRFRLGE